LFASVDVVCRSRARDDLPALKCAATAAAKGTSRWGNESLDLDAERLGDLVRHEERRAKLTSLETSNIVRRQIRELGQLYLGPAPLLARAANRSSDRRREFPSIELPGTSPALPRSTS
jgi:hypothetical protein